MNVFFLDTDPAKAAAYHCDSHANKLQLESAQLLSAVLLTENPVSTELGYPQTNSDLKLYRLSHKHHPSVKWLGTKIDNYAWLLQLTAGLNAEWLLRGHQPHRSYTEISQPIAEAFAAQLPASPQVTLVPFCAGSWTEQLTDSKWCSPEAAVLLYRSYYVLEKHRLLKWRNSISGASRVPAWSTGQYLPYKVRLTGGELRHMYLPQSVDQVEAAGTIFGSFARISLGCTSDFLKLTEASFRLIGG